ncbi:primosomal protein [Candidatus Dojkabacteria bacterium]|jgi:hypothetical protein|nr:primosomal protein [Candidatus Dojkabacteria bacterium]
MRLIREAVEDVKYLTEASENGVKRLFIEGTFLVGNKVNRNNRMYKMDTLRKEVGRYNEEYIKSNRALGELGHPDTPSINLERVSHKIISLVEHDNTFFGKALVLDTPYGQIVKNFIDNDVNIGVSSRALGTLSMTREGYNLVQDDLRIATAADIVADPSAPGAFVNGIMENKEWMFVDGKFSEIEFDQAKRQITKASTKQLEEVALQIFESYLRKL